ncbi:hypothetical protein BJ878DRAFT_143184 [Calycina marina]|uniref:Zn(2)-C6 fungal-type domain-containing protein n=1 Tax=Calycina marina TaxID=1763456 RepID=A0A9P7YZQ9_9HELO|nr:hypothetical protein BJ878DRAFT_143184 [Calycina marina]
MRSRTGCQTCRQRKLKCDEQKPTCGQCWKGSRECKPGDGLVFRHQQNASMNGADESAPSPRSKGRLGGFYAYKDTFDENITWVDVPKKIAFFNITDPYNMEMTPDPEVEAILAQEQAEGPAESSAAAPMVQGAASSSPFDGLEALSAAATSNFENVRPLSVPTTPGSYSTFTPSNSNNLDFILNPTRPDTRSPQSDRSRHSPIATLQQMATPIMDHETVFLIRHFSETAGLWMDLFDLNCYFSRMVPIQGRSNPLLLNAACSYAAKQLSRVHGRKAIFGGSAQIRADMEFCPGNKAVDWAWTASKYYDRAIQLLMKELSSSGEQETSIPPGSSRTFYNQITSQSPETSANVVGRQYGKCRGSRSAHTNKADETLAAASVLCVYEFLDHDKSAWDRHLSGTKSLFDLADKEIILPVASPDGVASRRSSPTRGRKATFWCFARQDYLAAFINETQTRLNTADLGLWKAAGLRLDDDGFVVSNNNLDDGPAMREDMISNALIWLLSKIVNYIAIGDSIDHVFPQMPGSPTSTLGINQMTLLHRWGEIKNELDVWYDGLPETFTPCARLLPVIDESVSRDSPRAIFSEIWYSNPMCASTMQSYHMAQIILLVNRPQELTARRSTMGQRIRSYRMIEQECRKHSLEICGIALGRPESSARIHQVQPLFVAGSFLTDDRERHVIVDILRGIEHDLGWATEYRIQDLMKDWGWNSNRRCP